MLRSGRRLLISLGAVACVTVAGGAPGSAAAGATAVAGAAATRECRPSIAGLNLQTVTIPQLQKALASGKTTSLKLVKAYAARILAYDGLVNSIRAINPDAGKIAIKLDAERAAGKIRGPLHGIPVLLKDNINTTDMPTTAGSIALEGSIPLVEATITTKLEDAGAIILGKTNLSEFANWVDLSMPSGYSSLGGQVRNAYTLADPSGSSSGSGVAGTMAFATGTVGTETSGSILSPSMANSLVGIKPTTGLLSRYGILPLAPSFDTPGPMTRNVTDAAIMLGVMSGVDEKDDRTAASGDAPTDYREFLKTDALEGARIGYSTQDLGNPLFEAALTVLEEQGATLVETDTLSNTSLIGITEIGLIPNEFKASLNEYLAEQTPDSLRVRTLSDIIAYNEQHPDEVKYGQNLLIASDAMPGVYHPATAEATIQSSKAAIDVTLLADDLDAIVAPGNTYANVSAAAGYPTVIVPAGYTGKNPFGLSFLADGFSEPELISFAYDYEQATKLRVSPIDLNAAHVPKGCR
ncbi:MAG TPA: amidase family protein [Actinomycetota bacterium]|nr:amidase family protein [Actinomycetota bacterium]